MYITCGTYIIEMSNVGFLTIWSSFWNDPMQFCIIDMLFRYTVQRVSVVNP